MSSEPAEDQTGRLVGSFLTVESTLRLQSIVVDPNGIFDNGSEGCGLIGALPKFLNGGDQFHRLFTEANAKLPGSIRMIVCHICRVSCRWVEWVRQGVEGSNSRSSKSYR